MKYAINDKHTSTGKCTTIGEFDTLEEARKELLRLFTCDLERFDSEELQSQVEIKLADGRIVDWEEFCSFEEVDGYEYILNGNSYDFDSHRYYIDESSVVYQAFVNGSMIAECDSSANQFAEQVCYDAINNYMSKLDSSESSVYTWIEADANEVDGSHALWSYDFDEDKWIIE